jgi:hypothetical protein
MIKKTTRSGDEQVDTLSEFICFSLAVGTSDDNTESLVVIFKKFLSNAKNLKGKFSGG